MQNHIHTGFFWKADVFTYSKGVRCNMHASRSGYNGQTVNMFHESSVDAATGLAYMRVK